jgi:hypothetical protein
LNGLKSGKDKDQVSLGRVCALMLRMLVFDIRSRNGFPPRAEPPPDLIRRPGRLGRVREPILRPAEAGVLFGT